MSEGMTPYYEADGIKVHLGDCRDIVLGLGLIDAVVTDPPYGLAFMGKAWDHGVPGVGFWQVIGAAMKPGAHLLAFGGTRTHHRLMVAIEDAGFEIRDCVMWVYGSGFPKSLDVSKAIDKHGDDPIAWRMFSEAYAAAVESSPFNHSDIDRELGIKSSSCYWARTDHRGGMPPRHHWASVRRLLSLPDGFAKIYDEAEREVVGFKERGFVPGGNAVYGAFSGDNRVTAPATDAAKKWDGWGTALKPAWEPIIVARKPLDGTVAQNVLKYGTGALNIDASRIETEDRLSGSGAPPLKFGGSNGRPFHDNAEPRGCNQHIAGRWPANLIHDGSDEVLDLFPAAAGGAYPEHRTPNAIYGGGNGTSLTQRGGARQMADSGSAARFFYCAKASGADRGNETKAALPLFDIPEETVSNSHPTVKPVALMEYLLKLVTPPGGIVLDPFAGSCSTLVAARRLGITAIGIEIEEQYCEIAAERLSQGALNLETT